MDLEAFEEVNRSPFAEGQDHSSLKVLKLAVQALAIQQVFEFKTLRANKRVGKWSEKAKIVRSHLVPLPCLQCCQFFIRYSSIIRING